MLNSGVSPVGHSTVLAPAVMFVLLTYIKVTRCSCHPSLGVQQSPELEADTVKSRKSREDRLENPGTSCRYPGMSKMPVHPVQEPLDCTEMDDFGYLCNLGPFC